jgi:hypothetical protein
MQPPRGGKREKAAKVFSLAALLRACLPVQPVGSTDLDGLPILNNIQGMSLTEDEIAGLLCYAREKFAAERYP